ncbi:MAG: TolC family protein [Saprospiraceae bacterium]
MKISNNTFTKILFLLCTYCYVLSGNAQEVMRLTLDEAIAKGQGQSPSAQLVETRWTTSRSQLQADMSVFKPQVTLNGRIPQIQRINFRNTLPDGRQSFVRQANLNTGLNLQLSQSLAATGGRVSIGSSFDYLYDFGVGGQDAYSQYATDMIFVEFAQPIFGFNELKWEKKLAPLRYSLATRQYAENMESLAVEGATLFFDLYTAQLTLEATETEKLNADTLFEISKGRFSVGRIAETDLLQIELSSMNANARLAAAILQKQTATEALRNFFGIKDIEGFELVPPTDLPSYILDVEEAVQYSRNNRSNSLEFQTRLLRADRNLAQAKGNNGFRIDVFARVGLAQNALEFEEVYKDPQDAQQINVGFSLPIADWGVAESRIEIAESLRELEQMQVEQERINIDQQVILRVQQFDLVREQVALALKAYEVSQKREFITRKRYLIGKIGVTELNLALQEQNAALQTYISALSAFWLAHYELRALTLYDFERGVSLVRDE